jgi:hypothetical protein
VLGRVEGRVQRVRVQQVPGHDILVCPELLTFEISRKGSRVGVGEDVVQLRQNVSGIGLKRLLRNCPVCHSKQQSILLEHREGGEGGNEPPVCIECKRNLADGGEPAKGASKRDDMTGKVSDCRKLLPQGITECVNLCTRHHPVEHSHRNDDVSRGEMQGVCGRVRDSKAIGLTYAL